MFELSSILVILFAHWIADFVLQSHNMAVNKSKSNYWLSMHVLTYTATITGIVGLYIIALTTSFIDPVKIAVWAIVNGALHWATDYVTSRINSKLWAEGRTHDFFVMVGFDQLIHYACLFGSTVWLASLH